MTNNNLLPGDQEPTSEKEKNLEIELASLKARLNALPVKAITYSSIGVTGLGVAIAVNSYFQAGAALAFAGASAAVIVNFINAKWRKEFDLNRAEREDLQKATENKYREREVSNAEANTILRVIEAIVQVNNSNLKDEEKDRIKRELMKRLPPADDI
jgi:hypothetical protein